MSYLVLFILKRFSKLWKWEEAQAEQEEQEEQDEDEEKEEGKKKINTKPVWPLFIQHPYRRKGVMRWKVEPPIGGPLPYSYK